MDAANEAAVDHVAILGGRDGSFIGYCLMFDDALYLPVDVKWMSMIDDR
jgi:hypothetical protein